MVMSTKGTPGVSKKSETLDTSVTLPDGVSAKYESSGLTVMGPLGKVEQDFSKVPVSIKVDGSSITFLTQGARRKDKAMLNTAKSVVKNAIDGVTKGYQ